ncbi:hypothetical protein ACFX1Z_000074 [Malus domestica]
MIKWAIAMGEFDISYQPKPAEKGQAVADFIADFTYPVDIVSTPKEVVSLPLEVQKIEPTTPTWSLYVDGLSNQQGCGAGLVLTTPDKVAMEYALRFKFKTSTNEAEYEALLAGLRLAKHLGVTNNFDTKDSSMVAYLAQTQLLLKHFHYQITQIPRAANSHAYALARLSSVVEDKIGRKFRLNCWQHQAPRLRKCATYNKEIVGLPRFIDSLLMAPFQMTKSKLSRFDTRLPVT